MLSSFLQMKPNLFVCQVLGWQLTSYYIQLIGHLYFEVKKQDKRKIEVSIQKALGVSKSRKEIAEVQRQILLGLFKHYYEKLFNAYSSVDDLRSFLHDNVEDDGMESLDAALGEGRGALFVTGHFGGVEFIPGYLAVCGYPVTILVRFSSELLRNRSLSKAAKFNTNIIDVDKTPRILKAISENLKENRIVVTQCDEIDEWKPMTNSTWWFLGKCINLDRTLNVLVKRTGASVVFGIMERQYKQKYKLIMSSLEELKRTLGHPHNISPSATVLKLLEKYIYAHPDQWYQWGKYFGVVRKPVYSLEFEGRRSRPYLNTATL
jgi:KDO2-lipid IV(A) lauroyltransferase